VIPFSAFWMAVIATMLGFASLDIPDDARAGDAGESHRSGYIIASS